jgi:ABC-type sugar transport system substrate-binding protein
MKTFKIVLAIVLSTMLLLTGCSTSQNTGASSSPSASQEPSASEQAPAQSATAKTIKLAYTCQDLTNTYFVEVARGVEDRCKELGIDVVIHDGKADIANQVTAFENFISQGVNAIIVSPIDQKGLIPSLEAAHKAGIKVIAGNQNVEGSDAFITVPEYEYGFTIGENAGKWIKEKLGGTAKVAIFDYPELESIIARGDGIQEGILSVAPKAEIVARQSANNPEKGMANMENILQANPGVEVLVGVNDAGVLGGYEAVMAAGKESDRFYIGGLDATPEALAKIKEGGIYRATVDIQPYESGKLFVDTTIKVLESGPIKDVIEIPMKVVDASNISEY